MRLPWNALSVLLKLGALVIGLIGLFTANAAGEAWFSLSAHLGAVSPPVLPGFLQSVLAIALITLIVTSFAWMPGLKVSGAQFHAYLAAARVMATMAAFIVLSIALARLGLNPAFAVFLFIALLVASALLLITAEKRNDPDWIELRANLFDFYSIYVLKPLDDEKDEKRQREVFSEFMHDSTAKPVRALSVIAPAALALGGAVIVALFAQFFFGLIGAMLRHMPLALALAGDVQSFSLQALLGSFSLGPWQLASFGALLAWLIFRRVARLFISHGHPLGISIGLKVFDIIAQQSFVLAAIYSILVPAGPPVGWWQPGYFGALLLTLLAATLALASHAGERLVRRFFAALHALRFRRFWIDCYKILKFFPQPKDPVGYVVFSSQNCVYTIASTLLVVCRLRQKGWALVVMDEWPIKTERTGNKAIDRFFKVRLGYQEALNFDWHIDWKAGKVEAAGMNFFHPIWEGLSRHFGRYTLDIPEGSEAERVFKELLKVTDSTLLWAFRLANTMAGYGKPVRILGASAQFVPNAVWNIFCRDVGIKRDMQFVWVQQGYQTYYADKAKLSKRITLDNMTRKWPYSNPYLPEQRDFKEWVSRGQDVAKITERAIAWTKSNRATDLKDMIPAARQVMERITAHRAAGNPVVCVLGKMVFDLSTPYERGPAHSGMFDWINHTVEIAARNPHVLYIVKPHPYEARPEIAGNVNQFFTDMIEQPIPPNMIILAHNWFNLHALFPHLDLGVLWNGTSGLELGLHGIPCIICSDWGPIDYPVGLAHPQDRADYERMMGNPKSVIMPADFTEKCALLLEYTASDELMIPYDYSARPITNEPFGPPYWYWDQVNRFIKEGDPNIDRACERFT